MQYLFVAISYFLTLLAYYSVPEHLFFSMFSTIIVTLVAMATEIKDNIRK